MDRTACQGTFTAIVTPLGTDGELDPAALRRLIDRQIAAGVDGLVPCGTTGESPTLTHEEHDRVIEITVEQCAAAGRGTIVMAGTGSNATHEALRLTRHARDAGAHASLQVVPYYNKPTQEGLYRHFMTLADESGLPICLYNIPGRSAVKLELGTIVRLARHPQIIAIKEAAGIMDDASQICLATDLAVLSGDDSMTLPFMAVGAVGVVSVLSNLVPEQVVQLVCSALQGNLPAAREHHQKLFHLARSLLGLATNPIPIKAAMALRGLCEPTVRLPLVELDPAAREQLAGLLLTMQIAGPGR